MFFTLEGGEGVGKSTLINLLKKYFIEKEIDFIFTREPGATPEGKKLRNILLDKTIELDSLSETFLLLADRLEHVKKIINPALRNNTHVLSDRYLDSTYAYQGAGRKIKTEVLDKLIEPLDLPIPDLTIYLDLSVEEGFKRVRKRGELDRFEKQEINFFKRIRTFYLNLANENPERFLIIDSNKNPSEIFEIAKISILNKINES